MLVAATSPQPTASSGPYSITTCEEFEKAAYFHPKDLVKSLWKIMYFWSDTAETNPIIFSLLTKKRLEHFKSEVISIAPELDMNWHKAVFMMEPQPGVQVLSKYSDTPGAFRGVVKIEQRNNPRLYPRPVIKLADVRMKRAGGYLGMMCCEDLTAFVMARADEVPATEEECRRAGEKICVYKGLMEDHICF